MRGGRVIQIKRMVKTIYASVAITLSGSLQVRVEALHESRGCQDGYLGSQSQGSLLVEPVQHLKLGDAQ